MSTDQAGAITSQTAILRDVRKFDGELPILAAQIADEVCKAENAWRDALGHAIRAGELLIEAKGLVKHGEWLSWLAENFLGSDRTARLYMRLATNSATVAELPTIREAVAMLTPPTRIQQERPRRPAKVRRNDEAIEREARALVQKGPFSNPENSFDEAVLKGRLVVARMKVSAKHAGQDALEPARLSVERGLPRCAAAASQLAAAHFADPRDQDGSADRAWDDFQVACYEETGQSRVKLTTSGRTSSSSTPPPRCSPSRAAATTARSGR